MKNRQAQFSGFTLIELLVVVAIIALLTGIFAVGTKKVKIISRGLQQKAVFHAMEIGLEVFSNDFDGFPNSALRTGAAGASPYVTGAQHLAEALLGRDARGFEPLTGWYPPNDLLYRTNVPGDLYDTTSPNTQSLARRKGPYCEVKYGQPMTIFDLWGGNNGSSLIYDSSAATPRTAHLYSPVITDVFTHNDTPASGRVGMPILYFKADPTARFRVDTARATVTNPVSGSGANGYGNWTFNFDDNLPVLQLPWLRDPTTSPNGLNVHYRDPEDNTKNNAQVFYEQITQTADPDRNYYKPYNSSTFILISAGWDGIFGTKDDIVNFD